MTTAILSDGNPTSSPAIFLHNGRPATTSREIAKFFGKRHDNVVRDIRNLISNTPKSFHTLNFEEMSEIVQIGNGATREDLVFNIYRDGFILLVMGYTGKTAMRLKLAYIEAFNAMEAKLTEQLAMPPAAASAPALAEKMLATNLSVTFQNSRLYLCSYKGEPYVPLRPLVEAVGLVWQTQAMKIKKREEWASVTLELALGEGRPLNYLCLPLRTLPLFMKTLSPTRVKPNMKGRVNAFKKHCRKVLADAWEAASGLVDAAASHSSPSECLRPLERLIEAWGEISGLSQKTLEAQVLAVFVAPSIAALDEEQASNALRWVQCRIDALAARPQQAALPEAPQAPALPPAIPKLDPADELDAELRKEAESLNDAQRAYASRMHVKVMKLVDWNACGLEWFDLASDVIFNMLCQRNGGVGAATRRSLPVAFATALNKLLVERRQLRVAALHDVRGAA